MSNPEDLAKLKASDKEFHKLELDLTKDHLTNGTDFYEIRSAIEGNTVVREVHVRMTKEFLEAFPIGELNKIFQALGSLPKLKYVCLGQMTGNVQVFGQIPVQAITSLVKTGKDKVLWLYMRGLILTHVYKGSEEEKEDKGDLDATIHDESAERSKRKSVKKKKDSKSKKSSKKSSKKDSKKEPTASASSATDVSKLDKKQAAAKRALDKLGDALVGLKSLKRISLMGHFDDVMAGCQLDPLFEGLGSLEELEIVLFALTRHNARVNVDPHSLGGFLDTAPKIKEVSLIYTELSDDHIDEVASALTNNKTLEELILSGTGDGTPETTGALFRAPHLKKLTLKEMNLDEQCVVAMCIALAHYRNLTHVEIQCALKANQLLALQQMLLVNIGLETLHLHITQLEDEKAPLELMTQSVNNTHSKLKAIKLEGEDKNPDVEKMRQINIVEWQGVTEGVFKVTTSNTIESSILSLEMDTAKAE